jgi:hypothetical protein
MNGPHRRRNAVRRTLAALLCAGVLATSAPLASPAAAAPRTAVVLASDPGQKKPGEISGCTWVSYNWIQRWLLALKGRQGAKGREDTGYWVC